MNDDPIVQVRPLGFPWQTFDPFLVCIHHDDAYPRGNAQLGPQADLSGRRLGSDFSRQDGWSMYHGDVVPGFPAHPHRGFETVTVTRRGIIDHADSQGAVARYGDGDVQWLTTGSGIVHAEMMPLLDRERPNPVDFFQIWLNLPARSKMAPPHFTMFWAPDIPRHRHVDADGRRTEVRLIAGRLAAQAGEAACDAPPAPPPDSWAAHRDADVAIWTITMEPGARWRLPAATAAGARRQLIYFQGGTLRVAEREVAAGSGVELRAGAAVELVNGAEASECLMLQGVPIGEPLVQHGPFVMNSEAEIVQAQRDFQRTRFGGWPWPSLAPVHGARQGRFARYPDGRVETPALP